MKLKGKLHRRQHSDGDQKCLTTLPKSRQIRNFPIAKISAAAQALIDLLDALGRDPDAEPDDPLELNGDALGDVSWPEVYQSRGMTLK